MTHASKKSRNVSIVVNILCTHRLSLVRCFALCTLLEKLKALDDLLRERQIVAEARLALCARSAGCLEGNCSLLYRKQAQHFKSRAVNNVKALRPKSNAS